MSQLSISMKLRFNAPLHITGDRRMWGASKAMSISSLGAIGGDSHLFAIPASTLKGNLRYWAETLLRTWGQEICQSPNPGTMCKDPSKICLACRIFGNPRSKSKLNFIEARAVNKMVIPEVRSGVSISRYRKTSMEQHLFFTEAASSESGTEWIAGVRGNFQTRQESLEATALIYLAAKSGPAIGGEKSRGLGDIESWQIDATIDGQSVPVEDLEKIWQSRQEG